MKTRWSIVVCFVISIMLIFAGIAGASMEDTVRESIPDSWMEAPRTASEMGISEFSQSPFLDEDVNKGNLAPVQQRLSDPVVVEPIDRPGDYGGSHRIFDTDPFVLWHDLNQLNRVLLFAPDPLQQEVYPSLAKGYEFSEDVTELTVYLREGLKWSDGEPYTADDVLYWWEAEANNNELNPVSPENWTPAGWKDVEKIDDYTVKVTFTKPNPLVLYNIGNNLNANWASAPAHYLKEFHPEYADNDKLEEKVDEKGFEEWFQLYQYIKDGTHPEYDLPTMRPYYVDGKSANSSVWVRNPYFPFVDTEGNQLPYIDRIRVQQIQDWTMYTSKISTGQGTFALSRADVKKLPLYKSMEEKEDYRIILGEKYHTAQVNIMPNLTHKDPQIRDIMQKVEFRRALSLAINREEMNQTFYFGQADPSALTVHPTSPYYEESYQKYIEYDPERAKTLLDEIGLVDENGDGFRELPDGESLNLTIEGVDYADGLPKMMEMITGYFRDVGLNIEMKIESNSLWWERVESNNHDFSVFSYWQAGPIDFPVSPWAAAAFVPCQIGHVGVSGHWIQWARWNQTGGESGEEPPAEIKEMLEWYDTAMTTSDEELRTEMSKKILAKQAEKVWTIGTVGHWPQPMIVSDNMKNVPEGFFFGSVNSTYSYHFETFFFEGGEPAK